MYASGDGISPAIKEDASMVSAQVREFLQQPLFAVIATVNPDGSPQ